MEETLAKYKTIDEAINEIGKLNVENRLKEDVVKDPRKIIDEEDLENYLAEGWDVQAIPLQENTYRKITQS